MKKTRSRRERQPSAVLSKKNAAEKISDLLDVPENAFTALPQIELSGNREAVIEGCQGILEYDENIVRLNLGKMIVRFTGLDLTIKCMNGESSIVSGTITAIEFTT